MAFLNNLKRPSLTLFYEMVDLIQMFYLVRKNVWTASLSCQTLWIKKMSKLLWLTSQAQKMLIEWLDKILLNSCHCKIRRWSLKIQWNFAPFSVLTPFLSARRALLYLVFFLFGLAGSETGNEYRTLSNHFSFAKTPCAPSLALVSSAL